MKVYMVTMAVVLLNLLIAVLSTAHDKVYASSEKEFHLARAKLIFQSARVVARRRPPTPLNLVKVVSGVLVDTLNELYRAILHLKRIAPYVSRTGGTPDEKLKKATQYHEEAKDLPPISARPQWKAIDGLLQKLAFAATMGIAALPVSDILWVLCICHGSPWVAWCILRLMRPAEEDRKKMRKEEKQDGDAGDCDPSVSHSDEADEEQEGVKVEDAPEAMPGQEQGDHWKNAWNLAKSRNHGFRVDCEHPHFNVVPFLESKTGLSMQHLGRQTKLHDDKTKSEEELVEVDRELADAPIDFKYLSRKVEKRRNGRGCGGSFGGGGGGGGGGGVRGHDKEGDDSGALGGKLMEAVKNLQHLWREGKKEDERRRNARFKDSGESKHVGNAGADDGGDADEGPDGREDTCAPMHGSAVNETESEIDASDRDKE
eukprot:g13585.t1